MKKDRSWWVPDIRSALGFYWGDIGRMETKMGNYSLRFMVWGLGFGSWVHGYDFWYAEFSSWHSRVAASRFEVGRRVGAL